MALFERRGEHYSPTLLSTGPWRPDALHGGPPSALIGGVVAAEAGEGEHVAGIQIDLERPVPIEPLTIVMTRRTLSRRISHLTIELHSPSGRCVAAKALLLRGEPISTIASKDVPPTAPDCLAPITWPDHRPGEALVFHRDAVEHRIVEGGYNLPGPSVAWLRLHGPVIAGETPSGLAQLLAVADFGSALSQAVAPGSGMALINVDVNVTLFRAPVGPWFCLEATGNVSDAGIGLAVTRLRDLEGPLGVVTQSQIAHVYKGAE